LINIKTERPIDHGWVQKVNRTGGLDNRYVVTTHSALYVCKKSGFFGNIKVAHIYPWVDLVFIQLIENIILKFDFSHNNVSFMLNSNNNMFKKTLYRIQKLPITSSFQVFVPPEFVLADDSPSSTYLDILISCCRSEGYSISSSICHKIRHTVLCKQSIEHIIDNDMQAFPEAITRALCIINDIPTITIGGFRFLQLFSKLSKIIRENSSILSLTVKNYKRMDSFNNFVDTLSLSRISSLKFVNVELNEDQITSLLEKLPLTTVKSLRFVGCKFNEKILKVFFKNSVNMRGIKKLEISKEGKCFSDLIIPSFLAFIANSEIPKVLIKENNINMKMFLDQLIDSEIPLYSLDLSNNVFVEPIVTGGRLPKSLQRLTLRDVKWTSISISSFLANQPFASNVSIDLSGAKFLTNGLSDPFENLADFIEHSFIIKFVWNRNPISSKILGLIERMNNLKELSIDQCEIISKDKYFIINSLNRMISLTNLRKLSIAGTFKNYSSVLINSIKHSISSSPSLYSLDISNNQIGDNSLCIIGDILQESTSIRKLSFNDSGFKNAEMFIQFLKRAQLSKSLVHISKPRKDWPTLISQSANGMEELLEITWDNVNKILSENRINISLETESSLFSSMASFNTDILIPYEQSKVSYLEASWNLPLEFEPMNQDIWKDIENEFSVETLTGISLISRDNDLIEF